MFTSRAEHRISLRHDSSDMRLFEKGYGLGLHSPEQLERFEAKRQGIDEIKELLRTRHLNGGDNWAAVAAATADAQSAPVSKSFYQLLKKPEVTLAQLAELEPAIAEGRPTSWLNQVELDVKYEGYVARQERQIRQFEKLEKLRIPEDFNYDALRGLSNEAKEKLAEIRPMSVGQAARIPGIRNADVALLTVTLDRGRRPVPSA